MKTISKDDIIKSVAGVIYEMAPYNNPRNIDKIIDHVLIKIKNDNKWKCINEFYSIYISNYDEIYNILKDYLFSCKEYEQLNISKFEWDNGKRDTSDGFVFTDRNIGIKEEHDFVDLDTCLRNIINDLFLIIDNQEDCFLCKHAKEYASMEHGNDFCKFCINGNNKNIKSYYDIHPYALLKTDSEEYKQLVKEGKIKDM